MGGDVAAGSQAALGARLATHLAEGKAARRLADLTREEQRSVDEMFLLTRRPVLYLANVGESDLPEGNVWAEQVRDIVNSEQAECLILSAEFEAQLADLDEAEKTAFLESEGLSSGGLQRLIHAAYRLLNLITFFTHGPKESRAWTVVTGTCAPQAGGQIHSDFERGFIRAETIHRVIFPPDDAKDPQRTECCSDACGDMHWRSFFPEFRINGSDHFKGVGAPCLNMSYLESSSRPRAEPHLQLRGLCQGGKSA